MDIILNGKLVDQKKAHISVCDHGFLYGDAVYETLRTVNGKPWLLNEHLRRLKDSAKTLEIKVKWSNKDLEAMILELIKKNKHKESRIRLTISRGCNSFDFTTSKNPTLVIESQKLKLPSKALYQNGVSAISYAIERVLPEVKSTSMLSVLMARKAAKKEQAFEAFLLDRKGNITEGSISNIFCVRKNMIYTPKENMLKGTVRNYLLGLLKNQFSIKQINIPLKKLMTSDEVFLTSTVKGVLPIVKIDGKKIGIGKVGPITKQIIKLFNQSIV